LKVIDGVSGLLAAFEASPAWAHAAPLHVEANNTVRTAPGDVLHIKIALFRPDLNFQPTATSIRLLK
jgi:hypothetical protein